MTTFHIITIFPEIFEFFLDQSILARAQKKKKVRFKIYNLRSFTTDKHHTVDDRPFGGGRGMVLKIEPIYRAISSIKSRLKKPSRVVLFTPRGKKFSQKMAYNFSKIPHIILICGRYEGVDERVAKYLVDDKISMGNFVSMGGELPALIFIESVARLIPGVIGRSELLKERITPKGGFIEYPQYTRPEVFKTKKGEIWKVPKVLLSGDHKKISCWRQKHSKIIE